MLARSPLTPHAYLEHTIDELSISTIDVLGLTFELNVFAYGHAVIGYDLEGDWEVSEIHIDGRRGTPSRVSAAIRLPIDHPLYEIIKQAVIDIDGTRIDNKVYDLVQEEREEAA